MVDDITYNRVREFLETLTGADYGYGSPMHKRLHEIVDKAEQYDNIMEIAREDSLASDGLDMIHSAMRDAERRD